jgi:hypothetical protein
MYFTLTIDGWKPAFRFCRDVTMMPLIYCLASTIYDERDWQSARSHPGSPKNQFGGSGKDRMEKSVEKPDVLFLGFLSFELIVEALRVV